MRLSLGSLFDAPADIGSFFSRSRSDTEGKSTYDDPVFLEVLLLNVNRLVSLALTYGDDRV